MIHSSSFFEPSPAPYVQLLNPSSTCEFGYCLGQCVQAGDIITLRGDLGAGKTFLTQCIAQGMGIEDCVTSPTFTLVQEYRQSKVLFHFDVYRIEHPQEMEMIGFEEYLSEPAVVVIEWPERIEEVLPKERLDLWIRYGEQTDSRCLQAQPLGDRAKRVWKQSVKLYHERGQSIKEEGRA